MSSPKPASHCQVMEKDLDRVLALADMAPCVNFSQHMPSIGVTCIELTSLGLKLTLEVDKERGLVD